MDEWTRLIPDDTDPYGAAYQYVGDDKYPHRIMQYHDDVQLSPAELLALATVTKVWREVDEVKVLVEACAKLQISCDFLQCELEQDNPNVIAAREHIDLATVALAPFEKEAKCTAI